MSKYCKVCRNEEVFTDIAPCVFCQQYVVDGPLAGAFQRWLKVAEDNSKCCGGLAYLFGAGTDPANRARGSLYFHGKGWEGSYKDTHVEYGVSFHLDYACTYFLRDFDSVADSEVYGDVVPYSDPDFWNKIDAQLHQAPFAAWLSGLRSCEDCGYHYHGLTCEHGDELDDNG